jgi:hypothetical protein
VTFVPDHFVVPLRLETADFVLEPLGPEHNDSDYAAWSSSKEHIHATPGWEKSKWPDDRDHAANLRDLERHAEDFRRREGFTYTVLDPTAGGGVIGCVYIYPSREQHGVTAVASWVRADRADLDPVLHEAVSAWLASDWPFTTVTYAPR